MLLRKDERVAIENLAAMFFEGSDDLCAVSSSIEDVIDRRRQFIARQKAVPAPTDSRKDG
jgi:hypothetical protein